MKEQFNGVSPVIGVILMVALIVGLATLVTVIGFNIGDEPSESPDATVKLDSTGDSVEVSVLRNENVEEIYVAKDGNEIDVSSSVGTNKNIRRGSGSYKVVAVTSDGSEQVIKEKDFSNVNDVETLSGSVKINPDIPGAAVEALDSSGTVIGTTTTDQDGSYTFNQQGVDRVRTVAKNIKPSDLSDPSFISHPLYASSMKQNKTGRVNFDFGASNVVCTASIDGNDRTIVLDKGVNDKLQIGNIHQLQAIDDCGLNKDYKLISDIDASVTSSWNGDDGFEPIGDPSNPFTGTLDGQEYTINGLYIDRPSTVNVGLIGKNNGLVEKIIFTNSDITGDSYVGTVVGNN
jgi:FlaG/FlaF family flagellin (archaellin)